MPVYASCVNNKCKQVLITLKFTILKIFTLFLLIIVNKFGAFLKCARVFDIPYFSLTLSSLTLIYETGYQNR